MKLPPTFILSPPRSYSSVVCAMLGRHPDLYDFPELNLFVADDIEGLFDYHSANAEHLGPLTFWLSGLIRTVSELIYGSQSEASAGEAFGWLCRHGSWSTRAVFEYLRDRCHKPTSIEKSPLVTTSEKHIHRLLNCFPDANYVYLCRHPYFAIRSLERICRVHYAPHADRCGRGLHVFCAEIWTQNHRIIQEALNMYPDFRSIRVHAEDLLEAPEMSLRRLLEWLGHPVTSLIMDEMMHPEKSPFARLGPPFASGGSDPSFQRDPAIRRPIHTLPGDWSECLDLPRDLEAAVRSLASSIGY